MSDGSSQGPDPLFLATAIEAVLHAGKIQMASFRGADLRIDKKGAIDLVTDVDVAVETWFRAFIGERFPRHTVLAEELQSANPEEEIAGQGVRRPRWIFDPIDGTTNYAHGLPIFCASLALEVDGELTVGAVYDPTREELYTAERGKGAFLNGQRIEVSHARSLIDALLCTGFHYDVHRSNDDVIDLFGAFVRRARAVRRLGSAALDLCYVAAGRLDGFWEARLKPWDVAAGALIVSEAGGIVRGMDGRAFDVLSGHVCAAGEPVAQAMLDVIRDFNAARAGNRTL